MFGSCANKGGQEREEVRVLNGDTAYDSTYVAREYRKVVKSTTFVPSDTIHDFGLIGGKEKVSHRFVFTNKGSEPVMIDTVKSHCGCTTSSYTREPIMPGKTGSVTVTYDPTDHYGGFHKTATLVLNGGEEYQEVKVVGRIRE